MKITVHLLLIVFSALVKLSTESTSENSTSSSSLPECPEQDICKLASFCCIESVDSFGWIAAAVGWSLLFLTLIIMCIGKVMALTPDEPKYLQA
ncbi:transmembrane protein 213 [Bombina bombina]|uniref:transmembrane protein 213 n=1 Tax=Bombina bombina TaxID=8345 RepID=UPI00235AA076|nr:transmembrane protein 213 [Bombina bombina]